MKKKNWLDNVLDFGKENSAAILTGTALVGLLVTTYSAYKAGIKANEILKDYHKDMTYVKKGDKPAKNAVKKEAVKKMVPVMLPTVIMAGATGACILGSHDISKRKIATLSAVYSLSEKTVNDLNAKMKEVLGDKKTKVIKDAIAQDELNRQGSVPKDGQQVIITGTGDVLCKDLYSGRFFRSNATKIEQVVNKISNMVRQEVYVTLNDFYAEIPQLGPIEGGENIGWYDEQTLDDGRLPILLSVLLTDEKEPCLTISFEGLRPV